MRRTLAIASTLLAACMEGASDAPSSPSLVLTDSSEFLGRLGRDGRAQRTRHP